MNRSPGKVTVIRKSHFAAAHRLHNPAMSDEWNQRTFGLCNSPNYHGHNYEIEVGVTGHPDAETGMVIDLHKLSLIVEEYVVGKCDHKNLNLDVDFLKDKITSSENLVIEFWNQLVDKIPLGKLEFIRLYETAKNWVEYRG